MAKRSSKVRQASLQHMPFLVLVTSCDAILTDARVVTRVNQRIIGKNYCSRFQGLPFSISGIRYQTFCTSITALIATVLILQDLLLRFI
jgi:hypothetical protein